MNMAESKLTWDKSGMKSSPEEIAAVSKNAGGNFPE